MPVKPSNKSDAMWLSFWDRFGISPKQGPLVGLVNSIDTNHPTSVVAITSNSLLWISDLRVNPVAKILTFNEEDDLFLFEKKPVKITELPVLFKKLLALVTEHRVGWLRLVPRSQSRGSLGRNMYWDKIADSLAVKIQFNKEAEITSIGTPQHTIFNGILDGLSRLRHCSLFLATTDPEISWKMMMDDISPLDNFTSDSIFERVFSKPTQGILDTGMITVAGKTLPMEIAYDMVCEFTQRSLIKRLFGKLDAQWFGIAMSTNDEDRQFFWIPLGLTFEQFLKILISTVTTLVADLSISQFMQINDRIKAIPVAYLPITSDASKAQLLSGLFTVSTKLVKLLGFVEWNCELFEDIKTAKRMLSDTMARVDTMSQTLQTTEKATETLAGQIESTRSRIQFSIHLMSEKIAETRSPEVLDRLSKLVADVETVLRHS